MAVVAMGFIVAWHYLVFAKQRRNQPLFGSSVADHHNLFQLLVASFLTIYMELALIRWVAVEVRVFAYIKNLTLLLCFLGFGLGCALARSKVRWANAITALLGLLLIIRWPWYGQRVLEGLSQALGAAADLQIWNAGTATHWLNFVLACLMAAALLFLIASIFVPLGQVVSRQMDLAENSLSAYSWNLAGNLGGILAFFAAAWASLPPVIWLTAVFAGLASLRPTAKQRALFAGLMIPAFLLLYDPATAIRSTLWTPYQQIEVTREFFPSGDFYRTMVWVNHTGYQIIADLSPAFLGRHPGLVAEAFDDNPYNLPFRFAPENPSVLVVGAGTGNDVAASLRQGSQSVDAVEIDPDILKLGKREHPEQPYSSPKVTAYLTDARAFMKRTQRRYDLVLFGLLDSHTQLSDYSNMRIDNFVYTEESFREARDLLKPDGVLFIKFQVNREWLGKRIADMLQQTFGKPAEVFEASSTYPGGATCYAISKSGRVESQLGADPRLARFVKANRPAFLSLPPAAVTTDDWPYLYQEKRSIPGAYFSVAVLVVLLSFGMYWSVPEARTRVPSPFFLGMGAAFLLLETQTISRLALYFGTTWQVNGIVIAAMLTTILVANFLVERWGLDGSASVDRWILTALLASLAAAYLIPFHRIPWSTREVGLLVALVFAVPVFFAALLFARKFRITESPSAALGANMLGAVVGGLLENASLVLGMRALILVAIGFYVLAGIGLARLRTRQGTAAPRAQPTGG